MAGATSQRADGSLALKLHRDQGLVHRSRSRFRVVVTGRRWGKTTLEKAETLQEFGTKGLVWYVAPTFDMSRELMWEPLKAIVPRAWLVREPNETRMEMDTIWGCRFACKSAEHPDRLRGRGPRKFLCDEFQDWKDGKRTWEEVLLPSLLDNDGTAMIAGTPKSFNQLYDLFTKGQTGVKDWASWQFRTADAPHIDKALLAQWKTEMDPRSYRQEFEASFESLSGRAYYAFSRIEHVRPVVLQAGVPVAVSFDFNINPATATIGQGIGDETRFWREVWVSHAGGEATRAAATAVKDKLKEAKWQGAIRIYGDPSGKSAKTTGPSDHAILRESFPGATWCIPHAAPHVRDRVAAVNARCETMDGKRHLVVDPSCVHLISDLEQVIFKDNGDLDKTTNPMLTHISDAGGYWVHQVWPVQKPRVSTGSMWAPHLL